MSPTKIITRLELVNRPGYRKPLWGAVLTATEFHASGCGRAHSSTHPAHYFPTTIILYKSIALYIFHTSPAYRPQYRNLSTITIHKSINRTLDLSTIKSKVIHNNLIFLSHYQHEKRYIFSPIKLCINLTVTSYSPTPKISL